MHVYARSSPFSSPRKVKRWVRFNCYNSLNCGKENLFVMKYRIWEICLKLRTFWINCPKYHECAIHYRWGAGAVVLDCSPWTLSPACHPRAESILPRLSGGLPILCLIITRVNFPITTRSNVRSHLFSAETGGDSWHSKLLSGNCVLTYYIVLSALWSRSSYFDRNKDKFARKD